MESLALATSNVTTVEAIGRSAEVYHPRTDSLETTHWKEGLQVMCQSEGPPIVLVDMDNTLVDWESQFERLMARHHPQIPIVPPVNRTEFKIELNYNDEFRDPILHLTSLDEFWLTMDPTEGALEALNEMVSSGLIVFILTTPDSKHTARSAYEKITWIERHLGMEWKAKTILAHDKTLVKGDILIDDKPAASHGLLRPSWTHLIFAQPYNTHVQLCPRLEHWNDWGSIVYTVLLHREREKLRVAKNLWSIEDEKSIRKKHSNVSDSELHCIPRSERLSL